MPKPPPIERFKVATVCDKAILGEVIAALTKMGLDNITFDLVTEVVTFRNNSGGTGELLQAWVNDHPTFKAIDAARHFEANGLTRGSCYPALRALVEKGILKKLSPGNYAHANVKHIEGPKKEKKTRVAKSPPKTFDKRGEDVIITYAKRNHGRFNTAKLVEIFTSEGRAQNSVYASIDALIKHKQAKRVGDKGSGQYVLLSKATKPKATPKPKPSKVAAPVTNGSAVEEVTHG
jgi:hypothetical protein